MHVPPAAEVWTQLPSWEWHRAGVDGRRSRTVVAAARIAARLERTVHLSHEEADRRLRTVPGIGVAGWTTTGCSRGTAISSHRVAHRIYLAPAASFRCCRLG